MKRHVLRVLCPVDFSESSRRALRYAAALAGQFQGRLTVLFVEDLLLASAAIGYDRSALARTSTRELRRFVNHAIGGTRARSVDYVVSLGVPAREIEKVAKRRRADMVVMGTHGLRGPKRLFFGSTTREVLRRATVPVLAVPGGAARTPPSSWPGHRFLAGIELGAHARSDARAASEFARGFGAALLLVHVLPDLQAPSWFRVRPSDSEGRRVAKARRQLEHLMARLGPRVHAEHCVLVGDPANSISAEAVRLRIGLIVLVLRGARGVFGPRPGSITYQVLCQGLVPVVALPSRFRPRGPSALKAGLRGLASTTFL
ncbi:MAG: universal stress protein [Vicinamibacterales bacterium]